MFRSITFALVTLGLVFAFGCTPEQETPIGPQQYGYVSLVDGSMGVIDLNTMEVVSEIQESHRGTHMLHVIAETGEVIYGDWDHNQILILKFNEDMTSYEVTDRIDSPVQLHGFQTLPPNDRYIVVLSRLELTAGVLFDVEYDDSSMGIYDRDTGEWTLVPMESPAYGSLGPDGLFYVANVHHGNVAVIDPATFEQIDQIDVGPAVWPVEDAIGPKGLAFAPGGEQMVTADYEGLTVSVFDVNDDGLTLDRMIEVDGAPKAAAYTKDGAELWVVSYDLNIPRDEAFATAQESMGAWYDGPQPADETNNAFRSTTVYIYNTATWELVDSFQAPHAMISPRMSETDDNVVFITTSAGSVYSIDRASREILGEAVVGRVGLPVVCGHIAL
jgi:hypothetical protein